MTRSKLPLLIAGIAGACLFASAGARAAMPLSDATLDNVTAGTWVIALADASGSGGIVNLALTQTNAKANPLFGTGFALAIGAGKNNSATTNVVLSGPMSIVSTVPVSLPGISISVSAGATP